jgi:hypothetical protein
MVFSVPTTVDLNEASQRPTVAVDVGFGNSSTSGIAWSGASPDESNSDVDTLLTTNYGSCADEILRLADGVSAFNLILEAPLFGAFDEDGNPMGRLPLEKRGSVTRYWYLQAGANVGLGAAFLLRDLANRPNRATIHLFEGFMSFKEGPSEHEEDAKLLLSEIQDEDDGDVRNLEKSARQEGAASCISVLELLGFNGTKHDLSCPPVVVAGQ